MVFVVIVFYHVLLNVVLEPGIQANSSSAVLAGDMAPTEPKYDIEPYDGTPGEKWEQFDERLLILLSGEADDRGWSLADYILGQDETDGLLPIGEDPTHKFGSLAERDSAGHSRWRAVQPAGHSQKKGTGTRSLLF